MVGGGDGAFIGAVHRQAAQLDNKFQLVCGAFSSKPKRSLQSGLNLGLDRQRCYTDYQTMFAQEASLNKDERMQCVIIVTPNHLHFPVAMEALKHGFHVLSDKPATTSLAKCQQLAGLVQRSGLLYGLTHPYVAYPMVSEARSRVAAGQLGQIKKIIVEYTQGWLANPIEKQGNSQAAWRLDPEKSGLSCCMADIGVHAFNLTEFISGLSVCNLSAHLNRVVPNRLLDDDGTVLLKFENGAQGVLLASQICLGEENNLRIRIYGDKASLDWSQEQPNSLCFKYADKPSETLRTGNSYLSPGARANTRLPAGHPEGYIEAFANIYNHFAEQIHTFGNVPEPGKNSAPIPDIQSALRGMTFIEAVVQSSSNNNQWQSLPTVTPIMEH